MKSLLVVLTLFLATATVGEAKTPQLFRAKTVRGTVQAMYPWSPTWSPVTEGELLPFGTLIQVFADGRISLMSFKQPGAGALDEAPLDLMFANLTMIRLDEGLVRKSSVKRMYFDSAKQLANAQDDSDPGITMSDAWNKVAAYLPGVKQGGTIGLGPDGMPIANERIRTIKLLRPTDSHDITPYTLPVDFRIIWKEVPDKNLRYEVSLWRTDEMQAVPVGTTRLSSYLTHVDDYGSYFVQVRSTDGRYESEPHRLTVRPPVSKNAMRNLHKRYEFPPGEPKIVASAPAPDLDLWSKNATVRIDFSWSLQVPVTEKPLYELTVRNSKDEALTLRTSKGFAALNLAPESYRWEVKSVGMVDDGGNQRSKLRPGPASGRFKIEPPGKVSRQQRLSEITQQIKKGRSSQIVYLPTGL